MKRVSKEPPPWTHDPVLANHRFTNVYRASDRVSQYLIRNVIYQGSQEIEEIFFRTILFKLFNRIDTWEALVSAFGECTWSSFSYERYVAILDGLFDARKRVYSAAYIMPSPRFGSRIKHQNHLRLLEHMMNDGAPAKIHSAKTLEKVFLLLRGYPSFGDFLAFQFAIDLNYSSALAFEESEFVVAGPGARNGLRKCFVDSGGLSDQDVIRAVTDMAESEFERLGLDFPGLWGRPLQLIDCQNLFCEVDKYSRVVHPEYSGESGRTRIKQKYKPTERSLPQWYPPKWNLTIPGPTSTSRIGAVAPEQLSLIPAAQ